MEPYALYLLRRFRSGESVGQLVSSEGIPRDRIIVRLLAAGRHQRAQKHKLRIAKRQRDNHNRWEVARRHTPDSATCMLTSCDPVWRELGDRLALLFQVRRCIKAHAPETMAPDE